MYDVKTHDCDDVETYENYTTTWWEYLQQQIMQEYLGLGSSGSPSSLCFDILESWIVRIEILLLRFWYSKLPQLLLSPSSYQLVFEEDLFYFQCVESHQFNIQTGEDIKILMWNIIFVWCKTGPVCIVFRLVISQYVLMLLSPEKNDVCQVLHFYILPCGTHQLNTFVSFCLRTLITPRPICWDIFSESRKKKFMWNF